MVDLDISQPAFKRFYLQHDHKYGDFKELTSYKFHYDFVSFDTSDDNPYLFVVDWQITEPDESNVTPHYPTV